MPDVHFIVPELTNHEVEATGDAAEGTATSIGWLAAIDTRMNQAFVQKYTEAIRNRAQHLGGAVVCDAPYPRRGDCRSGFYRGSRG